MVDPPQVKVAESSTSQASSVLPLPVANMLLGREKQSYSIYRFLLTRLEDGREIKFEARYSDLREWYQGLKERKVISDDRITRKGVPIPFPGKHLLRTFQVVAPAALGSGASPKMSTADASSEVPDLSNIDIGGDPPAYEEPDDYGATFDNDFSAEALSAKRRWELEVWLDSLLLAYPRLLKEPENVAFLTKHKTSAALGSGPRMPAPAPEVVPSAAAVVETFRLFLHRQLSTFPCTLAPLLRF